MIRIVVRSTSWITDPDRYFASLVGAHTMAQSDAAVLNCVPPSIQSFVELLEEGRPWTLIGGHGNVSYRIEALLP